MTSTLQANSYFDNSLFSSNGVFSRRTYGKPAQGSTLTSTGFGTNIWQSNIPQPILAKRDSTGRQNVPINLDQQLTIALPDIKLHRDRSDPFSSDYGSTRHAEPLSANSSSRINDITVLTPTSTTLSESEHSSQIGTTNGDQRDQRTSFTNAKHHNDHSKPWPTAKEFQPSGPSNEWGKFEAINNLKFSGTLAKGKGHKFLDSQQTQISTVQRITDTQTAHIGQPSQIHAQHRSQLANFNTNFDRNDLIRAWSQPGVVGMNDLDSTFSAMKLGKDSGYDKLPQAMYQATTGKSRQRQENAQDQQPYASYWTQNGFSYQQNSLLQADQIAQQSNGSHQACTSSIQRHGTDQSVQSFNNSSIYEGQPVRLSLDLAARAQISPDYVQQNATVYSGQGYSQELYKANANGMIDVRGLTYPYGSPLGLQYMQDEPILGRQNEPNQIVRSPLLEEFRMTSKSTRKFELKDIYGHIVEFSGDQLGSRFIQNKLEVANSDEKERVFNEIASDSRQLMTDVFGNYVIQKMFEHGNQHQKKLLANHMKGHVFALSTQTYGCRVVQKALEHILTDQQASLIKELDGLVLKVVENQNGNHVIQKAIERVPGEHIQFIVDAHRGHVIYLSKHSYGCRVIQRMLEYCQPHAKRAILDELHSKISDLIQDAFGNYVVQHVIVNGESHDRKPVIDKVQSRLLENAMHKFASNVVEKALDYAEEEQCRAMLRKLTGRDELGNSQVIKLLSHQYGNYVIQRSAAHLTGQPLATLIDEMEQYLGQLRRVSTGRQVAALENSIREARMRLNSQRLTNGIHNAPTEPSKHMYVRR